MYFQLYSVFETVTRSTRDKPQGNYRDLWYPIWYLDFRRKRDKFKK